MQLVGRILWWNDRDGFGVIEDTDGNEFYFDLSVVPSRSRLSLKRNLFVSFQKNPNVKDCACAYKLKIATAAEKKRVASKFDNRQLRLNAQA